MVIIYFKYIHINNLNFEKVMIDKFTFKLANRTKTYEEAKELYNNLHELLGSGPSIIPSYPVYPNYPAFPYNPLITSDTINQSILC